MAKTAAKSKLPTLEELNIVMSDIDSDDYKFAGTSLSAYLFVDYKKIIKLLGEPNAIGDTYKVDAEWEFEMNGKRMTIYNYKDGKNYNGRNGLPVSKITEWHIGSSDDVTKEVKTLANVFGCESKMM